MTGILILLLLLLLSSLISSSSFVSTLISKCWEFSSGGHCCLLLLWHECRWPGSETWSWNIEWRCSSWLLSNISGGSSWESLVKTSHVECCRLLISLETTLGLEAWLLPVHWIVDGLLRILLVLLLWVTLITILGLLVKTWLLVLSKLLLLLAWDGSTSSEGWEILLIHLGILLSPVRSTKKPLIVNLIVKSTSWHLTLVCY